MTHTVDNLFAEAQRIMQYAYAPYSKFLVGSALLTRQGNMFSGCNIENASYGLTLCAESNAISHMVCAGEKDIQDIVVVSNGHLPCAPCGACRQKIREFASAETRIHICNAEGIIKSKTIQELLPDSFGPANIENV